MTVPTELVNDVNELLNTLNNVDGNTDQVEQKLDEAINELQDIELDVESVDLNTDEVENKLDSAISELQDVDANTTNIEADINEVTDTVSAVRHIKNRNYAEQPDGDLVGEQADGAVNSFSGNLDPNEEVVINGFTDSDGWSAIEVFISSDQDSALQGVKVDYTDDVQGAQDVLATRTRTFTGEAAERGYETLKFETDLDGFRVRYENGDTAASNVNVVVTLRTQLALDAANYVGKNTLGDSFVRIGTSEGEEGIKIGSPTSLFGDLETIERTTLIDTSSSFGTSSLRDEIGSTGSGAIAEDPNNSGEIILSTGNTADSEINLRTAAYGRYTPGYSAQAGMGIRLPTLWNEGEGRWGYFTDTGIGSGFYFGYDADQSEAFIGRIILGTEVDRIYRSAWNGTDFEDVFDKQFDLREGYIFQIDFSWYGYGIINFQIVAQTIDTSSDLTPRQEIIVVHSLVVENSTSVPDPNAPIRIELENGANGDDNRLAVGGRQFSVFGEISEETRITSDTRFSASIADGAWTYIMSWQRADPANDANARLDVNGLDISADQTMKIAIVLNANISGTAYNTPTLTPQDETLLEVSLTGSFDGIGTGRKVWEGHIKVGGTGNASSSIDADFDVDFGQNGVVTLLAWAEGGVGEADATMRLREDW